MFDFAVGIRFRIHFEHLSESGIGISTCAVSEISHSRRNVVIEGDQFHIIFEHIHYLFQVIRVP